MTFNAETLINAGKTFLMLFGELFGLFIGISFIVALLQVYISQERIKRILTTPRKGLNSFLGAMLGAVTPFCSCSTIPVLVGLFKSGAPFCGAISFLLTSPILNPAIITLMLAFFGLKATIVYAIFTFLFAVIMGLILDKLGFEKEIKNVTVKGGHQDNVCWENLKGTFWQKQWQAIKLSLKDAFGLFKGVVIFLLLGAGIGAFIYEFIPTDLLANFAGASNLWAVPLAAIVGIPMYIRTETMIPIASILISKGVAPGVMIALILGGAGASIPEVSLLTSIFKKKMVITFVLCIFAVATITGYVFNFIL
ncbi:MULTISPECIES: permease [unclassified Clostridium]|uniref:permease n=1 Tax=unclassified Clostridium TaxID=2614128 RepID=UPI001106C6FC|nr:MULTISPECIES: permease [unclassified Clostridium]MBY1896622.1 permease [Clostridioides difficile]